MILAHDIMAVSIILTFENKDHAVRSSSIIWDSNIRNRCFGITPEHKQILLLTDGYNSFRI
jgi:hypothetical protein